MNAPRFIVVVTTVGSLDAARALARALVERKLAACAQIAAIESVYEWQGRVENGTEFRLWMKTLAARYGDVEAALRALHPYELPAIYALPVESIFAPYADWVEAGAGECRGEPGSAATGRQAGDAADSPLRP